MPAPASLCPCDSSKDYQGCCQPFHLQQQMAAHPETLMRSRFSAFALNLVDYLRLTWHPDTCPEPLTLADNPQWLSLEVIRSGIQKYPRHHQGFVHFRAYCKDAEGNNHVLEERSRFIKQSGHWLYLDGSNSFTQLD